MSELSGLVLAGGFSRRMGVDKAMLDYHGEPQVAWTARLLRSVCSEVVVSCRAGQGLESLLGKHVPLLHDEEEGQGPLSALLHAQRRYAARSWLVVACDLPRLTESGLQTLVAVRDPAVLATAYRSTDGLPEPLCCIYEAEAEGLLRAAAEAGLRCPRKVLIQLQERVKLVDLPDPGLLDNANTPEEAARVGGVGLQRFEVAS